MKIDRRQLLALGLGASALSGTPRLVRAADDAAGFPNKAIKIVMPYTAGGAPDEIAHVIQAQMQEDWGQPVIVEPHPGANGIIACEYVVHSPPDGNTMVMGSVATNSINATAYKKLPYDPINDFTPIALVGQAPMIITGHPSVPAKTLAELIAYAKANPGKLTFASAGLGSLGHLAGVMFQMATGTQMVHVPYPGQAEQTTALVSGYVKLSFSNILNAEPFIKSGQLRAYAVTSKTRLDLFPDVPAVAETIPNFEATLWYGLFGPAHVPAPVAAKLSAEAQKAMNAPQNADKWKQQGISLTPNTPEQFASFWKADVAKWGATVKAAGVSL